MEINKELTCKTFYGGEIALRELSHQHISNILWFFKLLYDTEPHEDIRGELNNRFGGIQLPYHPLVSFPAEIKALCLKGYTTGELNADIHVNGVWVGKIKYN